MICKAEEMRTTKESASTQFVQYTDPGKKNVLLYVQCPRSLNPFYILRTK